MTLATRIRRWWECFKWGHLYSGVRWGPRTPRPTDATVVPIYECRHCGSTYRGTQGYHRETVR